MPKVVKEDIDALNAVLNITITKEDYEPILKAELKKYRNEARIKGFRPGKTPASVIKKRFGKSILVDTINKLLQEELVGYLRESKDPILGQPMGSKDQEEFDFNINELEDYLFKFDIGLAPEFEVAGLNSDKALTFYKMEVDEKMIDEEVENARNRMGANQPVEDTIKENDLITLKVEELTAEGELVFGGISNSLKVLSQDIVEENFKEKLPTLKAGDQLNINLLELEKDIDAKFVNKNYLGLEEDLDQGVPPLFLATIEEVGRLAPAEMNQEFFDGFFGPGVVNSEEEFREKFRTDISGHYKNQSDALFFREVQQFLLEENELPLPEDFLKRWIKASNEELTEEQLEKEFPAFKKNLKWSLISEKLNKKYDIQLTEEDIKVGMRQRLMRMYGPQTAQLGDAIVDRLLDQLMSDEEQVRPVREEVLSNKLYEAVVPEITKMEEVVSFDKFMEISQKAREEVMAEQEGASETTEQVDETVEEEPTKEAEGDQAAE